MSFGENLRLMRKARNLTQEQFAEALGVSRQAVSKWEADSGYPEAEKLIAISRCWGFPLINCWTSNRRIRSRNKRKTRPYRRSGTSLGCRRRYHRHHDF